MLIRLNRSSMITILPECAVSRFSLVIGLRGSPGNELHTFRDYVFPVVLDQQVYMIGRDHVIQYAQIKPFSSFEQPANPVCPIPGKLKQIFLFMASVSNVPDLTRQEMSIGSRHGSSSLKL